ncbi:MAG: hypothetical protein K2H49_06075, partial [Muribaculaceae bacterium]|nr:hypothetical protein [Muribaculaceae bacterium]
MIEGIKFYHYMLGFLGIIAGALGWWWVVTFFVDKLRGHFNHRTMKLINVVVGIIILIFAAVGIISSTASMLSAAGRIPVRMSDGVSVSFRVADTAMKGWHADFSDEEGRVLQLEVVPVSKPDPFGDSKTDALSVKVSVQPSGEVLGETAVVGGIDPYKGKNSRRIVSVGDSWNVFSGNREYSHILSFVSPFPILSGPEIVPFSQGDISVSGYDVSIGSYEEDASEDELMSGLRKINAGGRQMSGIYSLLDYEQDDSYAVIGGNYRIAVLPADSAGIFDVFYMDGAKANSSLWSCGMKKGRLTSTPFPDIFDVEWR